MWGVVLWLVYAPALREVKKTKANIKNANNLLNERKPLLEDYIII